MAGVQTPGKKVVKTPVKNTNAQPGQRQKIKRSYCMLCRTDHFTHDALIHAHSLQHHRELEAVLGMNSFHRCEVCNASFLGIYEYAQHIATAQHTANLKRLISRGKKPLPLSTTLSKEAMDSLRERNKSLRKKGKKAIKKQKKKLKQIAGQKRAEMLKKAGWKNNRVVSKFVKQNTYKQVRIQQHVINQQGRNYAVVQNKENKVSHLQRPLHQRESTLHNQSGRLAGLSGEPAGQTHPNVRDQCTQSAQQLSCEDVIFIKAESSNTVVTPYNSRGGATWPKKTCNDYYKEQYDGEFTSDHLPHNGAIIFDHAQDEISRSSQSGREGSAQFASANGTANAAPIRDVDVSSMLRQIRRALGVREPCRADREARRQNAAPASHSGGPPSSNAPPMTKQATSRATQQCEKSSVSTGSHGSTNLNTTCKVRIAHNSANVQRGKEAVLETTMNRLLSLSGSKSRLNWREMYELKRKKRAKCMPRFQIEVRNPPFDQERSAQATGNNTSLSEGFHWESFPDSSSGAHRAGLPPRPHEDTIFIDSPTESQSDCQILPEPVEQQPVEQQPVEQQPVEQQPVEQQPVEQQPVEQQPVEQPDAAQEGCSGQAAGAPPVKMEPKCEGEDGDQRGKNKRKHNMHDGASDKEPSGKKKKTKSNKADQDQMDQLLAVSLREDELSHSLQDLDKSLVQARSALQAAYTEVQRLLLLRQQFISEVNSLRTQRIEILQGMQGGYTGASNVAEKATASTARLSPLPSSSAFPSSPTVPASSISPLAMPTMPVKQETLQPSTAGPTSQFAKPVSSNADPLLPSPRVAAPTPAVTPLKQLKTEGAASPNTNLLPESSARLQTAMLVRKGSDSEGETMGGVRETQPAPENTSSTFVPKRSQNASAAPDPDESESDASVEMMEPSDVVVIIDIDESDNEDAPDTLVQQEPPQKSVSVEFSSSDTQKNDTERKVQLTPVPVKDASVPPDCVDLVDKEPSVGSFVNHTGPVHDLQVHDGQLYTCSGDNTARAYSLMSRECQAVFEGHTNKVNCLLVSSQPNMPTRLYTGSSDQTIRCFSIKTTKCLEQITLSDRVLCLHIAWNILFAGLANGSVASYDLKNLKQLDVFECHGPRGVSCLGTAQEGARRVLLVGSYDSTISVRDAKSGLLLRTLEGHTKTVLCMKVVNDLVFSGSSDTSVHAHNIHTGELIRIYKGHGHAVTSIVILGKVMVTACLDKLVRVYELQSHDRLQVYGGHSDMVMCMAVHKSVVYTGCYDGSVQAVKLNLMKNYRCWWPNCTLIFGMAEHLLQHLTGDHSNPNLQTIKCRWRGCSAFFGTQQAIRQKLPEHMQSHVENDSKVQP